MIIDSIEALVQENKICDVEMVYTLIEKISHKRPVSGMSKVFCNSMTLLTFLGTLSHQINQLQGIENIPNAIGLAQTAVGDHGTLLPS